MATTPIILQLLKFYTEKIRSPQVDYSEFADYVNRYAQHHIDESPELIPYTGAGTSTLQAELENFAAEKQIAIVNQGQGKKTLYVLAYFIDRFTESYTNLSKNFSTSFPSINDIPHNVPTDILSKQNASDLLYKLMENQEYDSRTLYAVLFGNNVPALLLPSTVSVSTLIDISLKKLQDFLRKGESHEYFLKKLTNSNPGKELAIKNFFKQFVAKPEEALDGLRHSADTFYYWSQMFYFIKQDYNKVKDFTTEDVNVLQSIGVIEVAAAYYKAKAGERQQKEVAFKQLEEMMHMPPYYFTMEQVSKMKDNHGQYLLGKYSEKDLKVHLESLTSETIGSNLPEVLIFRTEDGSGYFIFKEKVMPLIVRLCNDARVVISESLTKDWYNSLSKFETLPEMKEQQAFENCLERELRVIAPILYGILHSSFLPVLAFDDQTPGKITLYRDDMLIPYSELLLLNRQEIYSDAKIKLPFWHSIPILSWIMSFIVKKSKARRDKDAKKTSSQKMIQEEKENADKKKQELDSKDLGDPQKNRKRVVRQQASEVEQVLVPANSTLNRELDSYLHEWNDRLGQKSHDNLTEDVNTLIRDYTRKILRTFKNENFSVERVDSLAQSLVDSPALMKVKNHPALKHYIELYMTKLIKNLP